MSDNIPSLKIAFSNNNIAQVIQNIDGYGAMIGTGLLAGNRGKVFVINNLTEAEQAGITVSDEPAAHKEIMEFYQELAGDQTIYVLLVAPSVTMAQMLDSTNPNYANKLVNFGAGSISKLGVFRQPPFGYAAGAAFFDSDVAAAITASKTFATALNAKGRFLRVIIQGRISDETSTTVIKPNTYSNGYAGVVCGDTISGKGAAVGLTLGRAVKYPAHIKIGKRQNGALSANAIYIGTKKLGEDNGLTIAAVDEVRATATLTITTKGTDDTYFSLNAVTPAGWVFLASYQKVIGDNTEILVATAITAAINSNTATTGFSATRVGAVITISAKVGLGDTMNTLLLKPQQDNDMAFTSTPFASGVTAKPAQAFTNTVFHNAGFISFMTIDNYAGYYFGIDNMASDDDFKILAHGAVIDAAAKVVNRVYTLEQEGEVDTEEDGTIKEEDAAYLEANIEKEVKLNMGDRISGFYAVVNRDVNIISTSKTKVKMRVRPKGYNSFIEVDLGLDDGTN